MNNGEKEFQWRGSWRPWGNYVPIFTLGLGCYICERGVGAVGRNGDRAAAHLNFATRSRCVGSGKFLVQLR